MKILYKTLLLSFLFLTHNAWAQETFISGFEDLPLMKGLIQNDGELYFDSPAGRIVESYAYSDVLSAKSVFDFYKATLPQLGWHQSDENTFAREGETLDIETSVENAILHVKFFLQPN